MSPISITVTYDETQPVRGHAYGLKITVDESTGIDSNIFVYRAGGSPSLRPSEPKSDAFICIADPVDMEEYPVYEAELEEEMPYYRSDTVTLYFRNLGDMYITKERIQDDIRTLVKSVSRLQEYPISSTETYTA